MSSSLGDQDATGNNYWYKYTNDSYWYAGKIISLDSGQIILKSLSYMISCIGLLGNGYVIWLLGFQIKRNRFTTFILNLGIADFGFLIAIVMYLTELSTDTIEEVKFLFICEFFYQIMYINSHFLLTAISIDRCVSVLFPIWHRCSQPKYLSPVVCAILWIFSFLLGGIHNIIQHVFRYNGTLYLHCLVTILICFPLITVSTVILSIKIGLKSKQKNQRRLLLIILITLLCYLILAVPLNVFGVTVSFFTAKGESELTYWIRFILLCSCLNSSVNPVIYYLVGRKKQAQSKEGLKFILQKIFKDEATGGR